MVCSALESVRIIKSILLKYRKIVFVFLFSAQPIMFLSVLLIAAATQGARGGLLQSICIMVAVSHSLLVGLFLP